MNVLIYTSQRFRQKKDIILILGVRLLSYDWIQAYQTDVIPQNMEVIFGSDSGHIIPDPRYPIFDINLFVRVLFLDIAI